MSFFRCSRRRICVPRVSIHLTARVGFSRKDGGQTETSETWTGAEVRDGEGEARGHSSIWRERHDDDSHS